MSVGDVFSGRFFWKGWVERVTSGYRRCTGSDSARVTIPGKADSVAEKKPLWVSFCSFFVKKTCLVDSIEKTGHRNVDERYRLAPWPIWVFVSINTSVYETGNKVCMYKLANARKKTC